MSRRRSSRVQRDVYSIASRAAVPFDLYAFRRLSVLPSLIKSLEDRRVYHPERYYRPARALSKLAGSVKLKRVAGNRQRLFAPDVLRFAIPEKVAVCVRRKERREVIFALKRFGRGGARRRSYFSDVSCK